MSVIPDVAIDALERLDWEQGCEDLPASCLSGNGPATHLLRVRFPRCANAHALLICTPCGDSYRRAADRRGTLECVICPRSVVRGRLGDFVTVPPL